MKECTCVYFRNERVETGCPVHDTKLIIRSIMAPHRFYREPYFRPADHPITQPAPFYTRPGERAIVPSVDFV